eukprot:g80992.t1
MHVAKVATDRNSRVRVFPCSEKRCVRSATGYRFVWMGQEVTTTCTSVFMKYKCLHETTAVMPRKIGQQEWIPNSDSTACLHCNAQSKIGLIFL